MLAYTILPISKGSTSNYLYKQNILSRVGPNVKVSVFRLRGAILATSDHIKHSKIASNSAPAHETPDHERTHCNHKIYNFFPFKYNSFSFLVFVAFTTVLVAPKLVHAASLVFLSSSVKQAQSVSHLGEKIFTYLRDTLGFPDEITLMIISALPVLELRGGIPVGIFLLKFSPLKAFILSCVGNILPMMPALLVLRNVAFIRSLLQPLLNRAKRITESMKMELSTQGQKPTIMDWFYPAVALITFIAIPVPGTGAWTGIFGAYLANMPYSVAALSISLGVFIAGAIVTTVCLIGRQGGIYAMGILVLALLALVRSKPKKNKSSHATEENPQIKPNGLSQSK